MLQGVLCEDPSAGRLRLVARHVLLQAPGPNRMRDHNGPEAAGCATHNDARNLHHQTILCPGGDALTVMK